ncbi:hypothetical protein AAU61_15710 [Desulfocarbo indianensis]|nr:hypothetical protein AAU61_15710 [Desulfocarbo indianensis]
MLVFDLQCDQGHRFEGWFDSHKDLAKQIKNKMIACPVCGAESVRQVPSSFAIAKRGQASPRPNEGDSPDPDAAARLLGEALKRYLKENFEDVGAKFANEALKMHFGATETRNIRGVSTPEEEKMLQREGVNFFKVGPPPSAETTVTSGGEEEDD